MKSNYLKLLKNTTLMYILTFSSYFFSFVSVPYQSRVLGPENFGRVSFALAFMSYFVIIIDYGFIISTIEEVVQFRNDKLKLSELFTAVTIIKTILFLISLIILVIILLNFKRLRIDIGLYIITFFSVTIVSFIPEYIYRGIEEIGAITKRTVLIRILFLVLLLMFLKRSDQYILVPLFNLIANISALIFSYYDLLKRDIRFRKVQLSRVKSIFQKSSEYFLSRIASTVYSVSNLFIIGLIYPSGSKFVGYYSSVERLISMSRSLFAPISDSLFPYMVKNRDYKLVRLLLISLLPFIFTGLVFVFLKAEWIIALIYGSDYVGSSNILRILIPIVAMTPFIYLFGFPILAPLGLSKHANKSVIFASLLHILSLTVLFITGRLNIVSLSFLSVVSEFVILIYRSLIIWINRNKLRKEYIHD